MTMKGVLKNVIWKSTYLNFTPIIINVNFKLVNTLLSLSLAAPRTSLDIVRPRMFAHFFSMTNFL
jgi:hypothetical protein